MKSIKRAFSTAIILFIPYAILFGVFKLVAHAEDMVVDEFVKYLLLVILPLGYILFITEGDSMFSKICKTAGFLIVVVSTLVYHLGITGNPDAFYLAYMILPISWWTLAVLSIHEYKGNDIVIEGWVILCSIVTLMIVLVVTQYIIFGTPGPDGLRKAVNTYLIVGGVALATVGIVCLKRRGDKRYFERSRTRSSGTPSAVSSGSQKYYCHDCKYFEFLHDDHGIIHYYCKLDKLERTYGEMQCSNKFIKRW